MNVQARSHERRFFIVGGTRSKNLRVIESAFAVLQRALWEDTCLAICKMSVSMCFMAAVEVIHDDAQMVGEGRSKGGVPARRA